MDFGFEHACIAVDAVVVVVVDVEEMEYFLTMTMVRIVSAFVVVVAVVGIEFCDVLVPSLLPSLSTMKVVEV